MFDFAFDLLRVLPHAVHATVTSESAQFWCVLRDECMIIPPSDIMLMHGLQLAGDWTLFGIVDALPTDVTVTSTTVGLGPFAAVLHQLAPLVREHLGRPDQCFGVTPLVIMRAVGKA